MTDKEKFQKTFEKLYASPDLLTEVLNMTEEKKIISMKKRRVPRIAVAALIVAFVISMGSIAYAKNLGGIQRIVQIWIHGDCTNAVLTEDNGTYTLDYTDENGESVQQSGGGVEVNQDGTKRTLTAEEFLDDINNFPDVVYDEDGSVWVYYRDQKWEITDKFEDDFCYITLTVDGETQYITAMYQNGYGVSPYGYFPPEDFDVDRDKTN